MCVGRQFDYVSRLLTINVFKRDVIESQAMVCVRTSLLQPLSEDVFGGRCVREYV